MVNDQVMQLAMWAALGALALAALGEWLHARRLRRLARLAFGPLGQHRRWVVVAAPLRAIALAAAAWSLVVLFALDGSSRLHDRVAPASKHLVVLLDVSPSMEIKDAGEDGSQSRRDRAAAVLRSVMERANSDSIKVTMACFYSDAKLLVKECTDREVIWNFADNLPLHMAFKPGKTSLANSLSSAANMIKDLPRKSATMVVLTDGDAVPPTGLKPLPSSVSNLVIVGVGTTARGSFIDGHNSRQDGASLSQVARRLGGAYFDGNHKQVPSALLNSLTKSNDKGDGMKAGLRMTAVVVFACAAVLICLLPLLLEWFGSHGGAALRPTTREVVS